MSFQSQKLIMPGHRYRTGQEGDGPCPPRKSESNTNGAGSIETHLKIGRSGQMSRETKQNLRAKLRFIRHFAAAQWHLNDRDSSVGRGSGLARRRIPLGLRHYRNISFPLTQSPPPGRAPRLCPPAFDVVRHPRSAGFPFSPAEQSRHPGRPAPLVSRYSPASPAATVSF